jgi:hypothetical protein
MVLAQFCSVSVTMGSCHHVHRYAPLDSGSELGGQLPDPLLRGKSGVDHNTLEGLGEIVLEDSIADLSR